MNSTIPIYIGFDKREPVAWHVCVQSILDNCSKPDILEFHTVGEDQRDGSNAFIYSRFRVPYLRSWLGWAIFLDGDMVLTTDILDLWAERRPGVGAMVVKHDYLTKYPTKYLGYKNEDYPRKNWSSVVLWNCGYYPNKALNPDTIAKATGAWLHRFQWLKDEEIGELPAKWNRLVLEQEIAPDDKLLHYTIGIPAFQEYADCDGAEHWWKAYRRMLTPIRG